jgi:hypothetical protein
MMIFLHPSYLWFFTLISLPILIHLFSSRKKKTILFSNLIFLKLIEHQNKTTKKLRNFLLLFIRCLIITFLVLTFAQPIVKRTNSFIEDVKTIYIDNSFSMSKTGKEGELLSQAKEKSKQLISNSNPSSRFKIITNENQYRSYLFNQSEAIEYIDKINFNPTPKNIASVINSHKKTEKGNQHFFIFSDFQKNSTNLEDIKLDSTTYISAIKLSPNNENNIFIDSVWFSSSFHVKGENTELNIKLINNGLNNIENIEVLIKLKNFKRKVYVNIPKKSNKTISINYIEKEEKFNNGTITIDDEDYIFDNTFFINYPIVKEASILIVNGRDFSKNIKKVYELDDFYTVKEIEKRSFNIDFINKSDLIILNGVIELSPVSINQLIDFISKGKSLIIFPGNLKKSEFKSWNSFMSKLKLPFFLNTNDVGTLIENINYKTNFFKPVFEQDPKQINLSSILKTYKIKNRSNYIPLINIQNKSPLFLKTTDKNIYLFTSSLTKEFSNFSSSALFVSTLLRAGELSIIENNLSYNLGEKKLLRLPINKQNKLPIHIKNESIDLIPLHQYKNYTANINLGNSTNQTALKTGNYFINHGSEKINELSINHNRKESITEYYSLEELKNKLGKSNKNTTSFSDINKTSIRSSIKKHSEYWKLFLFFALTLVIIETFLLRFWSVKTNSKNKS